jgi:nicotinamidase-related amidase
VSKIDRIIEKGQKREVEMYSAFYDPLEKPRVSDSGLAGLLKKESVTDVFVVGLAADYWVRATAVDAVKEGFRTFIVEEGTRAVDESTWGAVKKDMETKGVNVLGLQSVEIGRVGKI